MDPETGQPIRPGHPLWAVVQAAAAARAANQGPVLLSRTNQSEAGDLSDELGRIAQEGVEEAVSDEVFSSYQHREVLPGCRPHPGDIVEAGSLASLMPPLPDYPLADSFPEEVISQCKLSGLQLEGILYACRRHQMVLPNGTRAGFFIGDAAGVGKGRQIAGLIVDNFCRGRRRHVWFSISSDLVVDARRDLEDIGCFIKVIEGCQQLDKETRVFGLPADFKEGVIFSTYATLVSSVSRGGAPGGARASRLQQLVDWCGGDAFDGCLVFDECHKAKNFVPGKEQASTKVALAVAQIQRVLPRARVVYCSATGVADVKNMAFMERLGLWGDGAPFKTFEAFLDTVHRKGLGVAEMLAMEMKSSGVYVSRGLSYKQAEFDTVRIELDEKQIKMYDTAAHVWNELRRSLKAAVERTGCAGKRVWAPFWGAHQRFFKQLCLGMKVPRIVEEAQTCLETGHAVVIGLQTTGEASLESEQSRAGAPLSGFVSLCREILSRFIQHNFPTRIEAMSSPLWQTEDQWSVTAKQLLLSFANQIQLPISPLDELVDALGGPGRVAEMTGRRARMVRHGPGETPRYETRGAGTADGVESLNVKERNLFMSGKKLVAIISDAASTGISLHSDTRVENQRRRVHITIELPWSADKAVQQLGRSHRSNQTSGPLYKLMTTTLGGERRFAAAVARRLQSLGALTKGDRRAATGVDLKEFNFDTPYGRSALRVMYTAICQECLDAMDVLEDAPGLLGGARYVRDRDAGDVTKFLNRVLGLSVRKQDLMFTYFARCLDAQVRSAQQEGRYNEGLVDVMAASVRRVGRERRVFEGAAAAASNPTRHVVLNVDRGMTFEKATARLENNPGKESGFYRSRREMWGKTLYILATLKEGTSHTFKIARPNTGVSAFDEERTDLLQKYVPVKAEDAARHWREQYDASKDRCMHGAHCKSGPSCAVGRRCYDLHLLCGGMVNLLTVLETTMARHAARLNLSKSESSVKVVRAQVDGGERVIGLRYPQVLLPLVETALREQRDAERFLQQQLQIESGSQQPMVIQPLDVPVRGPEPVLEPPSPVLPRCRSKAFTPPVTIRNFFKPVAKVTTAPPPVVKATAPPPVVKATAPPPVVKATAPPPVVKATAPMRVTKAEPDEDNNNEEKNQTAEEEEPRVTKNEQECVDQDDGGDMEDFEGAKSKRVEKRRNPSAFDTCAKEGAVGAGAGQCNGVTSGSSAGRAKRPLVAPSSGGATKRARQASLVASFAKQSDLLKKERKKGRTCPICSKEFPATAWNSEINDHIDNCLID